MDYWRNLLGKIDKQAAEKIAYRNVENLLSHRVSLNTTSTISTTEEDTNTVPSAVITKSNWFDLNWQYLVVVGLVATFVLIAVSLRRKARE